MTDKRRQTKEEREKDTTSQYFKLRRERWNKKILEFVVPLIKSGLVLPQVLYIFLSSMVVSIAGTMYLINTSIDDFPTLFNIVYASSFVAITIFFIWFLFGLTIIKNDRDRKKNYDKAMEKWKK